MAATGLEVTLHQGRERAEVSRFTRTLDEIVRSLREIDEVYIANETRATWVLASLRHRRGNLIVCLEARNVQAKRDLSDMLVPVQALVDGAHVLQTEPSVPRLFTPATVNRLAGLSVPRDGVQSVSLATYNGERGEKVDLDESVKENAAAAVKPFEISWGTVTGRVFGVKELRAGRVKLTIRDELTRAAIDGEAPAALADVAGDVWRHRVTLGGKIKRNVRGQAIRMDVERIESMPEDDAGRPATDDLLGAAAELFRNVTVDEFVDRLRDD
ncbi:hypothetical protein [Mycolicibacterium helvum]|uniref:Uncharacterized protein n=1 Tax=Mycolicibacterium helvum TaxID=1534349 RepID=A0A7I7TGS9_9MYCO|nr:hypothetical protein [Mycolicibacterium helvum]BBY67569.1 hypothetical protein MHEL_58120 [Mycolicibacterium helvum]